MRSRPRVSKNQAESFETNVEQAKLTLERVKPVDQKALAALRERYEEVKKAVDDASARLAAERALRENRFIDGDKRRFADGKKASEAESTYTVREPGKVGQPDIDNLLDESDPYGNIDTRPGTREAQRDAGRDAMRALRRRLFGMRGEGRDSADGSAASVLGATLHAGFQAGEANALTGQRIESPADLAALAQVYRDPRFETFRAIYVKDGKVVGEAGYSSRLPAVVKVPQDMSEQIRTDLDRFGADGYYMLHNHPSGDASPSEEGLQLTNSIARDVAGFLGHVVIDHNEYAVIREGGKVQKFAAPELAATDYRENPAVKHMLLRASVTNPRQVVQLGKALQIKGGHATLVLMSGERTNLIVDVPTSMLQTVDKASITRMKAVMRRMARESGSGHHRFMILPEGANITSFAALVTDGVVTDVVSADGRSLREQGTPYYGDFLNDNIPVKRVAEEGSPYSADAKNEGSFRDTERAEIRARSEAAADTFELGQSAEDNLSGQGGLQFSRSSPFKPDPYDAQQYAQAVDRIAAMDVAPRTDLTVGDTPAVVRALGAQALPIQMPSSMIHKASRPEVKDHNVPVEVLRQIPALLADPVMVFDSQTESGALVVFVEAKDSSGRDVVIAVHLDAKGGGFNRINKIASIYGRGGKDEISRWMNGSLRYYSKEKAPRWLRAVGLQLPEANTIKRLNPSVLTNEDVVNLRYSFAGQGPALETIKAEWREAGISAAMSERDGVITVSKIVVPESDRVQGAGTRAMQQLIDYADANGLHIALTPSADFGGNKSRLTGFYKRFGFVENKGRNRVFSVSESMIRENPNGRPLYSVSGQASARPGITRNTLRDAIANSHPSLSNAVDRMLERGDKAQKGGLVVIESANELDIAEVFASKTGRDIDDAVQIFSDADGINGFYDPRSGITFMVGPNLTAETAPAVLLHEATHGKNRTKINAQAQVLLGQAKSLPPSMRAFIERVKARIEDAGETGNADEAPAYIVEQAAIEGRQAGFSAIDGKFMDWVDRTIGKRVGNLIRDFVAMIRAWGLRNRINLSQITVDDLVALAQSNIQAMSRGDAVRGGQAVSGSKGAFDGTNPNITAQRTGQPKPAKGLTQAEFRDALIDRFGRDGIASLERQGLLNFAQSPAKGVSAWYENGKAYFDPSWHASGRDAIAAVLHEVGTHHGIEAMLGKAGWRALKGQIVSLAREGGYVRAVWDGVVAKYPEFESLKGKAPSMYVISDALMHEIVAKVGETAAGRKSSIWRDILAAVNRFLLKMGVARQISQDELADLVQGSLKRVMAGKPGYSSVGGRQDMSARRSDLLPNKAEADQYRKSVAALMASLRTNTPPIKVMTTPSVLRMLGAEDLPITISRDTIRKATNGVKHNVTMEAIERLPEELANPVMVFESATEKGSLVVLTEYKDASGRPVMVAVELNAPDKTSGYSISRVASAYGRVPAEYMRFIERGLLRYRNTAKSLEWMNDKGLQLPNSLSATRGLWDSVPTEADVVNRDAGSQNITAQRPFNIADFMQDATDLV